MSTASQPPSGRHIIKYKKRKATNSQRIGRGKLRRIVESYVDRRESALLNEAIEEEEEEDEDGQQLDMSFTSMSSLTTDSAGRTDHQRGAKVFWQRQNSTVLRPNVEHSHVNISEIAKGIL